MERTGDRLRFGSTERRQRAQRAWAARDGRRRMLICCIEETVCETEWVRGPAPGRTEGAGGGVKSLMSHRNQ